MIHFRKGKKTLCGTQIGKDILSSTNRAKVTCGRCSLGLEVRDRKVVDKKKKANLKRLEKETTALWRKAVWLIWGGKCALCGKPCNDHNAHHYFTKGTHSAHRYEPYCGILLDYGCHIGTVHRGGEIERVRDLYIAKIGNDLFQSLKELAYVITKYPEDKLLKVRDYLAQFVQLMEVEGGKY